MHRQCRNRNLATARTGCSGISIGARIKERIIHIGGIEHSRCRDAYFAPAGAEMLVGRALFRVAEFNHRAYDSRIRGRLQVYQESQERGPITTIHCGVRRQLHHHHIG